MFVLNGSETLLNVIKGFVPGDLLEDVALAQQRLDEAVSGVNVAPGELAFDAGGDPVGGTGAGLDFEDVAVAGPDVEAAAYSTIGADGFGFLDAELAHVGFEFREGEDGAVADLRLDIFDDFDHVVEGFRREVGEVAGATEHGFFHERVAGADRDAVAAGNARGAGDVVAAIPEDAGVLGGPVDGEGFVDLDVLAGFDASAAEDALVGIVAIEGVGAVLLVGLLFVGDGLVLYVEVSTGVVDGAVLVVVVADSAVELMVDEDAIVGFALRGVGCFGLSFYVEAGGDFAGAGAG